MIVDALEHDARGRHPLVHAGERLLEIRLVEPAVLLDEAPHEARADARRAGVQLAAGRRPAIVRQHLRDASSGPAARGRAEPEVPVLAAPDEAAVVAADVGPQLAPIEGAHVDGAAREELVQREAAGAPDAAVPPA